MLQTITIIAFHDIRQISIATSKKDKTGLNGNYIFSRSFFNTVKCQYGEKQRVQEKNAVVLFPFVSMLRQTSMGVIFLHRQG